MKSDDDLDALLARGALGGPLREAIATRVLDARARRKRWGPTIAAVAVPLAMAAGVALFVTRPHDDGFTAKGNAGTAPALEIVCATGDTERCPIGERLFFRLDDATRGGFLHAWADPVGRGERVWYVAGDNALPVAAQSGAQTMKRAVRLGAEQPPGAYRVHVILARTPLAAADALAGHGEVLATATLPLEVTP